MFDDVGTAVKAAHIEINNMNSALVPTTIRGVANDGNKTFNRFYERALVAVENALVIESLGANLATAGKIYRRTYLSVLPALVVASMVVGAVT